MVRNLRCQFRHAPASVYDLTKTIIGFDTKKLQCDRSIQSVLACWTVCCLPETAHPNSVHVATTRKNKSWTPDARPRA